MPLDTKRAFGFRVNNQLPPASRVCVGCYNLCEHSLLADFAGVQKLMPLPRECIYGGTRLFTTSLTRLQQHVSGLRSRELLTEAACARSSVHSGCQLCLQKKTLWVLPHLVHCESETGTGRYKTVSK